MPVLAIATMLIIIIAGYVLFQTISGEDPYGNTHPPIDKNELLLSSVYGGLNEKMICPHCQEKGNVRTKSVSKKLGISGGKATAAILTGGWSLLATGLSRKENTTQAHCTNCNSTWTL